MVVIIILGLLTALIAPNVLSKGEQAKQKLTCVQMKNLSQSLEMFKQDNGVYPSTEQGLGALATNPDADRFKNYLPGGYLSSKSAPKDPWNSAYIYLYDESGYEIISLGADAKEGGADESRDLKLSECDR
jgi:general secretion pathway protein G